MAVALIAMIAAAVVLQAQQVAGQEELEAVRTAMADQGLRQAELRSDVAEAEAPAQVLEAAGDLGMVEPAAVVAVPAPRSNAVDGEAADLG